MCSPFPCEKLLNLYHLQNGVSVNKVDKAFSKVQYRQLALIVTNSIRTNVKVRPILNLEGEEVSSFRFLSFFLFFFSFFLSIEVSSFFFFPWDLLKPLIKNASQIKE